MHTKQNSGRAAVFLDRDGVLIKNIDGDYVRTVEQITVLRGVKKAIERLLLSDYLPVIVTNQAAVAKGFITLQHAWDIQRAVERAVAPKHKVISTLCPHAKAAGCECRKPKPGMLLEMAAEHGIDLSRSFLIGDAITDVMAARAVGVVPILVLTGRGQAQYNEAKAEDLERLKVLSTITEATDYILEIEDRK